MPLLGGAHTHICAPNVHKSRHRRKTHWLRVFLTEKRHREETTRSQNAETHTQSCLESKRDVPIKIQQVLATNVASSVHPTNYQSFSKRDVAMKFNKFSQHNKNSIGFRHKKSPRMDIDCWTPCCSGRPSIELIMLLCLPVSFQH